MSCAVLTIVGIWAIYAQKNQEWTLWTGFTSAAILFLISAYKAWVGEHKLSTNEQEVATLTDRPSVSIAVRGNCAHVANDYCLIVILPDVLIVNRSQSLRVAITADLWALGEGGKASRCAPADGPVAAWEQSQHSYSNRALTLPVNLEPRSADRGYLAFSRWLCTGVRRPPLMDEHQNWRYRIEFKDIHTDAPLYLQEVTVAT